MRIYMAGPLFTVAEIEFNRALATALRVRGHEVFLPQENEQSSDDLNAIFKSDVAGIDWAQLVLGNLDGADSDSGTCWELGYAYGKNMPTIVYRTDFRVGKVDIVNLMMTESANCVVLLPFSNITDLADRIDHEIKELSSPKSDPMLNEPMADGRRGYWDNRDDPNVQLAGD